MQFQKVKVNSAIILLFLAACFFAGWKAMLALSVVLFLFCEFDESTKKTAIRILTFYVGITLFAMAWDLIYDGLRLCLGGLDDVINTINLYIKDPTKYLTVAKVVTPIDTFLSLASRIVSYFIGFSKFFFIIAVLTGKPEKQNPISGKINGFVTSAVDFVNGVKVAPAATPNTPQTLAPAPAATPEPETPKGETNSNDIQMVG